MKKVLVIGSGGSGKSTFSRRLGAQLGLEVLHLDRFYWKAGWIEPSKEDWRRTVEQLLAREAWVMDGNYSGTLATRIDACDTIIFLDLPRVLCMWRIFKRGLQHAGRTRPDMAEGCQERLSMSFLGWVWNYHRRSRPKVLQLLAQHRASKRVVVLRSPTEVGRFLQFQPTAN